MTDRKEHSDMSAPSDAREGLRNIIVQQYLLHEVAHHSLHQGELMAPAVIVPKAHSLVDIWKCLHQGEFGVGHAIDHPDRFKEKLLSELRACAETERTAAPILESLVPDGQVLRVNLGPLLQRVGGEAEKIVLQLAPVCFESARITRGDPKRFFEALFTFKDLNTAGQLRLGDYIFAFPDRAVERFLIEIRELGRKIRQIPVFSHSETYRYLNRPAYRVVDRSVLENSPLSCLLEKVTSAYHDI
jgi:hypothetical protein